MADVIVINLEKPADEGTFTLKFVDGKATWVEDAPEGSGD